MIVLGHLSNNHVLWYINSMNDAEPMPSSGRQIRLTSMSSCAG